MSFRLSSFVPGFLAAALIAAVGWWASRSLGVASFSPAAAAYLAGAALRTGMGRRDRLTAGLAVAQVKVLRAGIVLLGFQLNARLIVDLGLPKVLGVFVLMALTLLVAAGIGRLLGVSRTLAGVLAVGTAVCGASAIAAAAPVLKSSDRESGYAVATVTLLGSLLTLVYPLIGHAFDLSPWTYGFWAGASLHEMAHAVSAGFAYGHAAGQDATVVKLLRVAMLGPVLMIAARLFAARPIRNGQEPKAARPAPPLFLLLFAFAVVASTVLPLDASLRAGLALASQAAVAMAMAAIGLRTDIRAVVGAGPKPFVLAVAASAALSILALGTGLMLEF